MDLFADYSFAAAGSSSRRAAFLSDLDMEDISPSSSRSSTPVASDVPMSPPPTSLSVDQLSARMNRHHIDPLSTLPLCMRLQKSGERRRASTSQPAEFYDNVRRRRQEGVRTLCSGARLASIETLVDRMLRDGSSCYASLHPSSSVSPSASRATSRNPSITSAPTSMPMSPSRKGSDDASSDDDSDDVPHGTLADPRVARLRFGSGAAAAARKSGGIEKSSSSRRKVIGRR